VTRAKTANLEYEQQCEIEVIYTAQIVEQISGYLFIDKSNKVQIGMHEMRVPSQCRPLVPETLLSMR